MSNLFGQFDVADLFIWYFVFIYSTVLHEAGHAWAALRLGDRTAYEGGQVSLDPTPHILREPFGMVLAPLVSWFFYEGRWMLGWASAPYDSAWAQRYPRRAALMAVAGPGADLLLLIASVLLLRIGLANGVFVFRESMDFSQIVDSANGSKLWSGLATLLSITFSLQVLLIPFNLLPLPPLDGSALPLFFLNGSASTKYQEFIWSPAMRMFGLFVAWKIYSTVFPSIFGLALRLVH